MKEFGDDDSVREYWYMVKAVRASVGQRFEFRFFSAGMTLALRSFLTVLLEVELRMRWKGSR